MLTLAVLHRSSREESRRYWHIFTESICGFRAERLDQVQWYAMVGRRQPRPRVEALWFDPLAEALDERRVIISILRVLIGLHQGNNSVAIQ